MTLLQIYFVIAGIILLVKFLFSVFTLKWLKKFFNDNKSEILSRISQLHQPKGWCLSKG